MSSYVGQTIWPTIYDTHVVKRYGWLSLQWRNGDLEYNRDKFGLVKGPSGGTTMLNPLHDIIPGHVTKPQNLVGGLKAVWQVHVGDGAWNVGLGLDGPGGRYSPITVSPSLLTSNLAGTLLVDCTHDADRELPEPDQFCEFTGPINPTGPASKSRREQDFMKVGVVAVEGAQDLRMFALACGDTITPLVLRQSACLECCLDVCRRTNFPVLIL
jgi:hypothetical protein